jgi:hypothetical protein
VCFVCALFVLFHVAVNLLLPCRQAPLIIIYLLEFTWFKNGRGTRPSQFSITFVIVVSLSVGLLGSPQSYNNAQPGDGEAQCRSTPGST